jgi:hypothetical protein
MANQKSVVELDESLSPVSVELSESGGLRIPVWNTYDTAEKEGTELAEPMIFNHSILQSLLPLEDLESLAIVKLVYDTDEYGNPPPVKQLGTLIEAQTYPDGVEREIIFSSGDNYYIGSAELKEKIAALFETEPDAAFRYGALLTSDCLKGNAEFENLRVKVVDYKNPDDAHHATHDCHGRISPRYAAQLGAEPNTPFQFRLAWNSEWSTDEQESPETSFLAKGTLRIDPSLEAEGYDLVLDQSSIKGIKKSLIEGQVPRGDYELPKAVMGNRTNAQVTPYAHSWQFTIWYSEEAIRNDLGPATEKEAMKLAKAMRSPHELRKYLIDQHDKQQAYRAAQSQNEEAVTDAENELGVEDEQERTRMIDILKQDEYGRLLESPKVVQFMQDAVARRWRDLAAKSGFEHSSGMAQPAAELKEGYVCVPHLPAGDVIITRYPIVNSDNIRIYKNVHNPEAHCTTSNALGINERALGFMQTRNAVYINPKDAEKYHQADFDGDQLICTPASRLPAIAKETLRAGEPNRFPPVKQRPKKAYTEIKDKKGNRVYSDEMIAVAASRNKVGMIANAIGRVQSSTPAELDIVDEFKQGQGSLLNRLFSALQVEVDYQKSAERHENVKEIDGANLLKNVSGWKKAHPVAFFDYCKARETYRDYALPTDIEGTGSVNVLSREIVNPVWESVRLRERSREEFREFGGGKPDHLSPDRSEFGV